MENIIVKGFGKCPKLPWMVEFHTTADGKIFNNQLKAAFASNYLEHLSALREESKVGRKRLTKFVVIIPPKVKSEDIEEFLKAGMTVAVLKIDYFTPEDVFYTIELIKTVNDEFGKKIGRVYPLAVALDIPEPEILTGSLKEPNKEIEFKKGEKTNIVSNPEFKKSVSKDYIYVNYDNIANVVKPGDSLVIGDNIEMSALEIAKDIVKCIVEKAGMLGDNVSVKLPNVPTLPQKSISREKLEEITKDCQIDIIFVGPNYIKMAKEVLGPTVLVFAKIENNEAFKCFNNFADTIDGILIDGNKLLATSKQNVFLVQKSIIANCNKLGKSVVSMINCNNLNKAHINDIANTIIDGVDALLLPPDADLLESICLICKSAEAAVYQKQTFNNLVSLHPPPIEPITSIAIAAVQASFNSNAAAIIILTTSGRSAKLVSRYRPRCPIIALTRFGKTAKQLMIQRGVIPLFYVQSNDDTFAQNVEKKMQLGMTYGKIQGYIKTGDAVVIVFGIKNYVGFRNCIEVVFASECDTVPDGPEDV